MRTQFLSVFCALQRKAVAFAGLATVIAGCGAGTPVGSTSPVATPRFLPAVNLGPAINSADFDGGPSITADGLVMYFVSDRAHAGGDIWVASRQSTSQPFGKPKNLGPVNSSSDEGAPSISADGLELFFDRAPDGRIFVARRSATTDAFGSPETVDLGRNGCCDGFPDISADGRDLFFCSDRPDGQGGNDVWVAHRESRASPFGSPANIGPGVNGPANDCEPSASGDSKALYFASDRGGGEGGYDIWVAMRGDGTKGFGAAGPLGPPVNSVYADERPAISMDGSTLYLMSNRPGGSGFYDLWECQIRR